MQQVRPNLFTRSDTMFGVCEALGRDFGFSPNILRVALGLLVVYNIGIAVAVYAVLGAIVAISNYLFPAPRAAETEPAAASSVEQGGEVDAAHAERDDDETKELIAAAA